MTTTSSPTETDIPAWIPLAASAGILGSIAWRITEVDVIAVVAAVLLSVAAVGGMSRGWFVGWTPPTRAAAPAQLVGLVGSRISVGGSVFTVLDDSAVRDAAGRRASVIARDGQAASGCCSRASTRTARWSRRESTGANGRRLR